MVNLNLKIKLLQSRLTQFELARKLGIGDALLSKIVNGWIACPDIVQQKIAEVLDCPVSEIFPDDKDSENLQ